MTTTNYYFDDRHCYRPYTFSLEANSDSLTPDNALRIVPEFKAGYWPCEANGQWQLIIDLRGKIAYSTETKESIVIHQVGDVPVGYTLQKPQPFDFWDGERWIEDIEQKSSYVIEQQTERKNTLLQEANYQIELLKDAINLDLAESNDQEKLLQWKKYRVLLNRLVIANPSDIVWPEKP
ncbi:tail fiber assembly protein [Pragia fontium]|uniref:Virus tail fibre assembly protein, lambda gpK n=1 Tax=Pragia fontium DSM 5563 = ATCC 49100 TaxID=1122977 RepID=A0AAJ4WAQ4_9GAMM|nr:tail assembly chaperone [Pragia fontium]AKJ42815.1 hypothetical protein QQ39_12600 [Pragia fontium]SFC86708.1 virus tail fibre assembly protein, lambda gpK [Pragia fontium DSM 5563 = ATCC 49100]VEJ56097.1 Caudovirales tail fibre assembly protein [Pragia fontium]